MPEQGTAPPPPSSGATTPPPTPQGQPPALATGNAFADLVPKQQGGAAPAGPSAPPPVSPDNPFADLITGASAPKPRSLSAALSDQIGDAAMAGLTPKISGAISGLEAKFHGQDYMPAYEAERNRINDQLAQDRAQHPVASTLGQIGGTVLNPLNEVFNKAGQKVASWGATKLGDFGKSMLFKALSQAGVPAAISGGASAAARTVGSPADYLANTAMGTGAALALGTGLGSVGQTIGKVTGMAKGLANEAPLYNQAKSAELYDGDLPKGYIDKFMNAVSGSDPDRPIIAQAYQLAQQKAASTGNPLPPLPLWNAADRAAEALAGRAGQGGPQPAGLSLRIIDETKKALNAMVRSPGGAHLSDVEGSFYKDFIDPVKQAVPEYGEALASHTDVAQAKEFVQRLLHFNGSGTLPTVGGLAATALGHPMLGGGGLGAIRALSALAGTPAARDVVAGAGPRVANELSPAAAQLVSMLVSRQPASSP